MFKTELIEIARIQPNPSQPRKTINRDSIIELANSILKVGLLQPIIVNINTKNEVSLIAGQRRLEAYKYLNKKHIECILVPGDASQKDFKQASIIENVQREEMTNYDTALPLKELRNDGMNLEEISSQLGKSISWVSKMLSVLELNNDVQQQVIDGSLDISKAVIIASQHDLSDQEKTILANDVVENKITKKTLEDKVKKIKNYIDPEIIQMQNHIQQKLGTKIEIKEKKLIMHYLGIEDLNKILEVLNLNYKD
ncbi:ParB/RepB/Spo0J family partition protein [Spiroplasma taiwanense]|uniref:Chromosome partitioning protein, DNA-binding protein n=1 Tax=Spiroplasma taiwanense CT-1 TaxID=1276220 RepID=S5LZF8_9MOLU|nr:ParB/RepB/Spo0J family partition protein [Spiroplasma taiwanense]AGR41092.1 chromosome partitioning protein, DNA-binding protein [Spiroplasma taiwanense CT-1]